MSDYALKQIIRKRRQLRNLLLARERVKQLERELRGEPAKSEDAPYVPEFLRLQAPIAQRYRGY
jgi:predicted component of type VI protein secretion system